MARNLAIGDIVFVPCSKFPELEDHPTAFYETRVVDVDKRSIKVNLPGQVVSDFFGISLAHQNLGLLIISIGDFATEEALIGPLSKSVLQYARLLLPDDVLRHVRVRSLAELQTIWRQNHGAYTHVVFIGHGSQDGIMFGVDKWISAKKLNEEVIRIWGGSRKVIISLCCKTGYKSFGGEVSSFPQCSYFIGPYHSVHGAIASQFCQTFLAHHLLEGKTVVVAFKKARESVVGSASFRLWESNQLKAGPKA
ncbi:hypothetical protein [Halomonas stenophila]|uniref:CHAT domain-containing protein n=1 Tax=Halomonas stenophila TaxID=795312 RepID=A0A7W5EYJ1_9GAMM|nr:hypothetical protein [Halomonas stenophila]MBB3232850.1 hypothetical protein [Halomonas stenophila]